MLAIFVTRQTALSVRFTTLGSKCGGHQSGCHVSRSHCVQSLAPHSDSATLGCRAQSSYRPEWCYKSLVVSQILLFFPLCTCCRLSGRT